MLLAGLAYHLAFSFPSDLKKHGGRESVVLAACHRAFLDPDRKKYSVEYVLHGKERQRSDSKIGHKSA